LDNVIGAPYLYATSTRKAAMNRNSFFAIALSLATFAATALASQPAHAASQTAVFAGGCFWCVESDMDHIKGVTSTISGYAGGAKENPTYEDHEGYVEAVKVEFDPLVVPYEQLVARFLRTIDVTDAGGQFCDRGDSYTTAIFADSSAQKQAAEKAVRQAEQALRQKLATPVKPFTTFTPAEDYHQNYYLGQNRVFTRFGWIKQSDAYHRYREACDRDARVKEVWGAAAYTAGSQSGS
jgi:peptide-methionine (S)-S-oxide reductase